VAGSTMGTRDELVRLLEMVSSGAVTPQVDSQAPLAAARSMLQKMLDGEQRGKLVVTV
jgi:D-arabinose 1-dehydrogenase-like Zn-dependent alcohol dehydrogenase